MKRPNCFISLVVVFFVLIFSAQENFACSCFPLPPIYQSFNDADAVFIGKVVASNEPAEGDESYDGHDIVFDFEVIENFKGVKGKRIKLNRGTKHSSCYSGYDVGETYLVYAYAKGYNFSNQQYKSAPGFVYQDSFCNRSTNLKTANDQLYFIREMQKGKPESQIYGSVGRSDTDPLTSRYRHTFLEGIKVVIENEKNRFETVTDKNGLYAFNNIPAGEYVIKPVPGADYMVYYSAHESITVLPDKKVASPRNGYLYEPYNSFYGEFTLGWNNQIEGRVVDSQEKPLERYVVGMLPLSKADAEMHPSKKGSPDHHGENGSFRTYGKAPGKYVLAVDVYAPFGGSAVKKRFFYPQAESLKDARIFDLTATSQLKDLEIKLPLATRYIKGEIFWSDGSLIDSQSWITLSKLEAEEDKNNTSFDWTNSRNGKFTLQVLEGFEYWVQTTVSVDVVENGEKRDIQIDAKPQKIKIGKEDVQLKFVLQKPKYLVEEK
jgi:hypothetical protein